MRTSTSVTVIVPTFNGESWLAELLQQVQIQKYSGTVEVLVIDSGSTDSTLQILKSFPEVKVLQIPNSEFGHGRTRNLGARHATGEFIVFLTQDAVPAHPYWLQAMLEPFSISPKVMAVFGKQTPRRLAPPLIKYEIQRVFAQFSPEASILLFKEAPYLDKRHQDFLNFYSDVNSATRREYLVNTTPLRDVDYAEDLYFAQDTIAAGYVKAYAPMGEVIHSNDLSFNEIRGRAFDETRALINLQKVHPDSKFKISLRTVVRRSLLDSKFIRRDPELSWKRRLQSLLTNPLMIRQQLLGQRDAMRGETSNNVPNRVRSLEAGKRNQSKTQG